jgi:hypothetical protein
MFSRFTRFRPAPSGYESGVESSAFNTKGRQCRPSSVLPLSMKPSVKQTDPGARKAGLDDRYHNNWGARTTSYAQHTLELWFRSDRSDALHHL